MASYIALLLITGSFIMFAVDTFRHSSQRPALVREPMTAMCPMTGKGRTQTPADAELLETLRDTVADMDRDGHRPEDFWD